ncbi:MULTISPECIES: hypothetical protein [Halorussus]|uniref:hypothetical protein n=1 Tax=Halorussus TaxID=1070314 RepID=UPI0020A0D735|nr:hypothetical protein [Halorussus vallis]USZ73931.1 hypothetical protein NGM07_10725 [Halorussus vallis]
MPERSVGDLGFGLLAVGVAVLYGYLYATTDHDPSDAELWWVATTGVVGLVALLRYASAHYRRNEAVVDAAVSLLGFGVALFLTVSGNATLAGFGGLVGVVFGVGALYEFHHRGELEGRYSTVLAGVLGAALLGFGVVLAARDFGSGPAAVGVASAAVGVVALAWAARAAVGR